MDNINTFEVSKNWFSYVAENINVKPVHTALYFFIFNKWNSLFWKKHFGLPTDKTMECLNIRSYKTYIKTLNDLEEFGFIKLVERSKNQNTSNIVEVVNKTNAKTKATTKALLKATTQSDDQSNVSIYKHYNKEQLNLLTKNHKEVKEFLLTMSGEAEIKKEDIDFIYSLYPSKCPIKNTPTGKGSKNKDQIKGILKTVNKDHLQKVIEWYLDECTKGKIYIKNFTTFLNNLPDLPTSEEIKKDESVLYNQADYDIPNDAKFGLSDTKLKEMCLNGEFPKTLRL